MNGILLFDKPILWTSHDAVDFIRQRVGQRSVGHAGTLDPLATGLLVVLLGKATKLSQMLMGLDKDYSGTMTLGITTDTQDLEGRILSTGDFHEVREDAVSGVLSEFRGRQSQAPPLFSAVRKKGRRLYDWTRRGLSVEVASREVTISELRLVGFHPPEVHFFMTCSKGTYVRALCDLVGKRLGCGGTLSSLVRHRVGPMNLEHALDEEALTKLLPEEIEKRLVQPTSLRAPEGSETI